MHQRRADDRVPGLRPVRQQHEPERHGVQLSVHRHARLRSSAVGAASAWRWPVQVVVRSGPLRCAPRPPARTPSTHTRRATLCSHACTFCGSSQVATRGMIATVADARSIATCNKNNTKSHSTGSCV